MTNSTDCSPNNTQRSARFSSNLLPRLGVNIDHIATLRNARGVPYPCPVQAAQICEQAGADGITLHLREDRRHIQDADVYAIKSAINIPMNLEMAVTAEMLAIALDVAPEWVCLVPEKRTEVTTEGGLNVLGQDDEFAKFIAKLQQNGSRVSLFIDPDTAQIARAIALGADAIELHTGAFANAFLAENMDCDAELKAASRANSETAKELARIERAAAFAHATHPNLIVNAGHGLTTQNVAYIAQISGIYELNIGHALVADSVFLGLTAAVQAMRAAFAGAV